MAQQPIEGPLLSGVLAVQRGLIGSEQFTAVFTETLSAPHRSWVEIAVEQRFLSLASAQALQQALDEQLRQHAGDLSLCLQLCGLPDDLRAKLERLQRPEIDALLRLMNSSSSPRTSDTEVADNDHFGTIDSRHFSERAELADPYSTGTFPPLGGTEVSFPVPTGVAPAPTGIDLVGSTGVLISGPVSQASAADTAVVPGAAPTGSLPPAQPATAAVDFPTHIPDSAPVSSAHLPTLIPDPDYSTLHSKATESGTSPPEMLSAAGRTFPMGLRFKVLREHAKGGLGKVSVAEDLELRREVAFKEIQHRFADDTEARSRFLLEAEITGSLEHPGIVPVYGLGTYLDGRPYYAMRFIRGSSLQQAVDAYFAAAPGVVDPSTRQVELRQLLRRFIDVCNAMDYAHSRGIIHRDLKPGNVMLGDYGETLVVDWGIAKSVKVRGSVFRSALERLPQLTAGGGSQTMMGAAIGTPQFMSPEQAEGKLDELGPASDIYSLGATLYCLLTGSPAFTSHKLLEILRDVKSGTFPPPIEINPRTPKPLNAICLKAMHLEPRYESAKALASDIENWIADEPVRAYSENRWERLSRWVRRHQARAQAAGFAGVAIALVAIVATILIDQSRRAEAEALRRLSIANTQEVAARKQETLAKQEALRRSRQTREAVDTLLSGMSDALDAFPGMNNVRRRLLERAAEDYARLAQEKNQDAELQAEAARSLVRLADVQTKLNSLEKARTSLAQAGNIFREQAKISGQKVEYQFGQAEVDTKRGLLETAAGRFTQALPFFHDAITALEDIVKVHPEQIEYQDALGTALIGLGQAEQRAGRLQDAGRDLQRALTLFQVLRTDHSENVHVLTAAAASEGAYALFLLDTGRAVEAAQIFEQAIELHDALVDEFPEEPEYFAQRATARLKLAEALRGLGRWATVVRNYESCVSDLQEVVRARPDVPRYRENLAKARTNLGQSLRKLGSNTDSVPVLEKALENFDELSASYPLPEYVNGIGNTRVSLAQVLSELGQQDRAMILIDLAITDYRELLDLQPDLAAYEEGLGIAQSNRGRILARRGDLPGGGQSFEAAIASLKAAADKEPLVARITDQLAGAWTQLGLVQLAAGQMQPARDAFQSALTIRQSLSKKSPKSTVYQDSLAWLLATCPVVELRDGKRAVELAVKTTAATPESPQYWLSEGAAYLQQGDHATALKAFETSRKLRGQDEGLTLCLLAIAEAKTNQLEVAKKTLAAAKAWQTAQKPVDEELSFWMKRAEEAVGMP
jgi:serine/threonine protein kinase/tetratricopeptide (TPR) repeat protein